MTVSFSHAIWVAILGIFVAITVMEFFGDDDDGDFP